MNRLFVIVEVALTWDATTARACAAHEMTLFERTGQRVCVLVIAPDTHVAEDAARGIRSGPSRSRFLPLVAGPDLLPRLITDDTAHLVPSFGLLAGIAHGNDPTFGSYIRQSATSAIEALPEPARSAYLEIVSLTLDDESRADWPSSTSANDHSHVLDFASSYISDARRASRVEGEAVGRARALISVLHARGIPTSPENEALALATRNIARLDRWLLQAVEASSEDEIFADTLLS